MKITKLLKVLLLCIITLGLLFLITMSYYESVHDVYKSIIYCLVLISGLICGMYVNIFIRWMANRHPSKN